MARGFKTGGRQKGTPNKATVAKRARAQQGLRLADERGVTPLDIMLSYKRGEGKYTREVWHVSVPSRAHPGSRLSVVAAQSPPPVSCRDCAHGGKPVPGHR
jgi:hypothetical protein